jgi:hypothetical protein
MLAGKILLLLIIANGAPIILKKLLGDRWAWPVDGGLAFLDGQPLLGASKTWRGVMVSILFTAIAAKILGFSLTLGVVVAVGAMLGDLCSSFIKRRLRIKVSGMAPGLDQIPESLFPLLLLRDEWELTAREMFELVTAFLVLSYAVSQVLYRLRIRLQPY